MRIPIKRGRVFTDRDNEKTPTVMVINDAFARSYFSGANQGVSSTDCSWRKLRTDRQWPDVERGDECSQCCALLARLAIDISMQGKGLGAALVYDALKRAAEVAEISAAYAVIVDALNEQAKAFYRHYRFEESLDDPMRLFLPMRDIRALLSKTGA